MEGILPIRNNSRSDSFFTRGHYALLILENFHKLIHETKLINETFMIVNPKLFPDQDIAIDENLAQVPQSLAIPGRATTDCQTL